MLYHARITLIISLLFTAASAYSNDKGVRIYGTKVYNEIDIIDVLNLGRYTYGIITAEQVIKIIEKFYNDRGYTLAKAQIMYQRPLSLTVYVDEGRLDKIIFINIDDISTIYLKVRFRLKNKIFNIHTINDRLIMLRRHRRWKNAFYQLKKSRDYSASLFQLEGEFNLPYLGKRALPFFDKFAPKYDLIIFLSKSYNPLLSDSFSDNSLVDSQGIIKNDNLSDKNTESNTASIIEKLKKNYKKGDTQFSEEDLKKLADLIEKKQIKLYRFSYGLKLHYYKGFIPFIRYSHLSILGKGDYLNAYTSAGIYYGIDGEFAKVPRVTYTEFKSYYMFHPTLQKIFTPHLQIGFLTSRASRPDLGIYLYNFYIINAMLAPGITLLSKVNMYTGIGIQTVTFKNSVVNFAYKYYTYYMITDPNIVYQYFRTNPIDEARRATNRMELLKSIEKRTDVYNYLETGFIYNFVKKNHLNPIQDNLKKEIAVAYDFYFLKNIYHKLRVMAVFEHEFSNKSIYSGRLTYQYIFTKPPFFEELPVHSQTFKGFRKRFSFTRNGLSQSNEYRISINREHLYIGAYLDWTMFEGSGNDGRNDLKGPQFAFVAGPTGRILLIDHFEFYIYYGWDHLFSKKQTGQNIYFNMYNRW
jgi:hypothetical protein